MEIPTLSPRAAANMTESERELPSLNSNLTSKEFECESLTVPGPVKSQESNLSGHGSGDGAGSPVSNSIPSPKSQPEAVSICKKRHSHRRKRHADSARENHFRGEIISAGPR